jgi:carbon storage regulator
MLVISRKPGESLILSDDIKITVISTSGDKVAIGIDAPKSVKIVREELLEVIRANTDSTDNNVAKDYAGIASMMKSKNLVKNPKVYNGSADI